MEHERGGAQRPESHSARRHLVAARGMANRGATIAPTTRLKFIRRVLTYLLNPILSRQHLINQELIVAQEIAIGEALAMGSDLRADLRATESQLREALQRLDRKHTRTLADASAFATTNEVAISLDNELVLSTPQGPPLQAPRSGKGLSVTVHGDWQALNGLAAAARRLVVDLLSAGVEVSVADFDSGATRAGALVDDPISGLKRSTDNTIHLWAVNVNEFGRVRHEDLHPSNRRQYNIATWYWEMEDVPVRFAETARRPDELWAPSPLVRSAFLGSTNAPIVLVHPSIRPMVRASTREQVLSDLGISPTKLVVLVSFDARSVANRKNPLGAIEAFRRAFGTNAAEAMLVVKAHSLSEHDVYANRLRAELASVNGVLIEEAITDQAFTDLLAASDVYLSLHRCEGFGLGMAEAMLLGKPVVATGFSGNRAFMTLGNSCLVGYTVRPLDAADLALHPDQTDAYDLGSLWAEPDLDQAASWLRLLQSDETVRTAIGERARLTPIFHESS